MRPELPGDLLIQAKQQQWDEDTEDDQAVDQEVIHCILGVLIDLFNLCSMQVLYDGEWDCKLCGDKLKNKEDNRVHIQQFCAERPDWEHLCVLCGLVWVQVWAEGAHIKMVQGEVVVTVTFYLNIKLDIRHCLYFSWG